MPAELLTLPERSAKDPRFRYTDLRASSADRKRFADLSEAHRFFVFMMGELAAAELVAANVYEVDDMPWDFYADMARQCWDEGRHTEINYRWFNECADAEPRTYEAVNIYYDVYHGLSLAGRLAALAVTDEARALDGQRLRIDDFAADGERAKARSSERIMHEEVRHVAAGNIWLARLAEEASLSKQEILQAGLDELYEKMGSQGAPEPKQQKLRSRLPVDARLRLRAGFSQEEIAAIADREQRSVRDAVPYLEDGE